MKVFISDESLKRDDGLYFRWKPPEVFETTCAFHILSTAFRRMRKVFSQVSVLTVGRAPYRRGVGPHKVRIHPGEGPHCTGLGHLKVQGISTVWSLTVQPLPPPPHSHDLKEGNTIGKRLLRSRRRTVFMKIVHGKSSNERNWKPNNKPYFLKCHFIQV